MCLCGMHFALRRAAHKTRDSLREGCLSVAAAAERESDERLNGGVCPKPRPMGDH